MDRYFTELAVRSLGNGVIEGTAAVYYSGEPGTEFSPLPGIGERIAPGAFDAVLRSKHDVIATFNHDLNMPLARTPDLKLWADQKGLQFSLTLPPTSYGADLAKLVDLGIVRGCSFAANIGYASWSKDGSKDIRTLHRFSALHDVSICTIPAFSGASLRSGANVEDLTQERLAWLDTFTRLEKAKALKI